MSEQLPAYWWRDKETLLAVVIEQGSLRKAEQAYGVGRGVLTEWWRKHDLPLLDRNVPAGRSLASPVERVAAPAPDGVDDTALLQALRKAGEGASIVSLADTLDASPRRVQAALTRIREQGYRVDLADESRVRLDRVPPSSTSVHSDLLPLLDGNLLRVGVVSDTHQSSKECALDELHTAYDWLQREGITTVLHAGDFTCGRGIFRGQDAEILRHTLSDQTEHLVAEYPRREGMLTVAISGNHDLEGEAGRVGYDPVAAFAAQRPDITYLGGYSAWAEVGAGQVENPPYVHLLHGKGGMSYAYSYKAQKLVDGYPGGRKPAVLIPGHWHVRGSFETRGVQVLFPGCFEWQSTFMQRLGLHPAVGFHLLEMVVGGDGSIVQFLPRWLRFWEGRVVG